MTEPTRTAGAKATSAAPAYSPREMMAIAAGREIRDGELAIFGVGLSLLDF